MARPRDREEAKTEKLNMRVTPSLKDALDKIAGLSGQKTGPWVEDQLTRIIAQNEHEQARQTSTETRQLLADIERHIFEIEQATEARWHTDLGTWAAVREMLEKGPIMGAAPQMPEVTDTLAKIEARETEVQTERAFLMQSLRTFGIESYDITEVGLGAWLVGSQKPTREREREQVEAVPNRDAATRKALLAQIENLETLDGELFDLREKRAKAVERLAEAIERGRTTYEQPTAAIPVMAALAVLHAKTMATINKGRGGMFGRR